MPAANKNKKSGQSVLPGMSSFLNTQPDQEFFFDGVKNEKYFDAGNLPDSPGYQANANGATTYVLYLLFPDKETQERALAALTNRVRTKLAPGAKIGSLNCVIGLPKDEGGRTFLEFWEEQILGIKPKKKKKVKAQEVDPDEAQAPI